MPSKMVALKELIFAHSNLMYENGIQPSNTEYSRKQKQLQKNYNILQYVNTSNKNIWGLTKNL